MVGWLVCLLLCKNLLKLVKENLFELCLPADSQAEEVEKVEKMRDFNNISRELYYNV